MADILLRPDLKTAGGEVCDIMCNREFVGTLTLVYREADRLSGSIQLERHSLPEADKQEIYAFMQSHMQYLIDALGIKQCEVLVTYSDFDFVIATDHAAQSAYPDREPDASLYGDDEADYEWIRDESRFDDIDPEGADEVGMTADRNELPEYELVIVGERRNRVDYHIYDQEAEIVAEASVHIYGSDVVGAVEWQFEPFEVEMDCAAELIVKDFDEDLTDTFVIHMNYKGEPIDTIELAHVDLLDEEEDADSDFLQPGRDDYQVVLVRDDGDTLTYEIYQPSYGNHPIGTATVDISQRQLTGFVDLREPGNSDDRELIATLLLEELDKEKDYETVNLSMLHKNKLIDEILFESDQVH